MNKLIILAAATVTAAGLAAPSFAADRLGAPYCPTGMHTDYSAAEDNLAILLQLATKPSANMDVTNGCIRVSTIAHGKVSIRFYDPDTLSLVGHM